MFEGFNKMTKGSKYASSVLRLYDPAGTLKRCIKALPSPDHFLRPDLDGLMSLVRSCMIIPLLTRLFSS